LALKNAALVTDDVTLDYKTKKKDQTTGVIEDLSGNDLQSIKGFSVENNTFVDPNLDLTAPTIVNAEINGDVLTITLDEDIKPTVPKANNFKVKIGRKKSKVESVTVDQATNTVVLALKNAALVTDDVTLDYKTKKKDQTTGVIEDLSGNDLQSIKGVLVENNTFVDPNVDVTFPTIAAAEINGDVLTITLDEDINSTIPKANNFKVKIGRKKSKVESVTVDQAADTVVLALKNAALVTDDVTLDYKTKKKDQTTGVIEDLSGNDLQSIKGLAVDNNTFVDPNLDLTAPTIVNAEINGDVLTITLDEAIDSTVPKANNFKVKIGRKKSKVEGVDVFDGTKLLEADLVDSEGAATTAPTHNSITTEAEFRALIGVYAASNGQSATFTTVTPFDTSFANGVQATVGAEVFEWNVGTHGANPDAGTGPHATRDGGGLSFTDDELAAMRSTTGTVSLTLKNAAVATDAVTLDYKTKKKDQVTGVIEDLSGNDLQSIKGYTVENITPAARPFGQARVLDSFTEDALMASSEVFDALGADQENPFSPFVDPLA